VSEPPLSGIRILDLTRAYAGPIGTLYLADLGADVIKVEAAARPDLPTRYMNPAESDPGEKPWERAAYFHRLNVGKRDITLDLTTDTGKNLFKQLVARCDVVAENYNPQTMRRFGLGYDVLSEINPRIILVSMSGFGADGPRSHWAAYYPAMEGMAGLTAITGYETEETLPSLTGYGDWVLGTVGAMAVLAALHHVERTGKGQWIDVSGRDAVLAGVGEAIVDSFANGHTWGPRGNSMPGMAPHDTYRCRQPEGWVAITVRDDRDWMAFCEVLGNPSWTTAEQFRDARRREENQESMRPYIEEWTNRRGKHAAADALLSAGVPAAPVLFPGETLFDAQLRARNYFEVIQHPHVGRRIYPRQVAAHYSGFRHAPRAHAPTLGQHNREVLGDLLGLSADDLESLESAGIIGSTPTRPSRRPPEPSHESLRRRGAQIDDDYLGNLTKSYGVPIGP
jgi:crotonobetainyl-CoA:carnitine CoA-transferase CaiB-like acyl-CoA transferase